MTLSAELQSFFDTFDALEDPRVERTKFHALPDILFATVCGVIAGCDGWSDIESFCQERLEYLRQYRPFTHGVPSDDTFRRVFRAIDPEQFGRLFSQWIQQWYRPDEETTIAIDGKTLRGSKESGQTPLHLVSAFASEARIVLGQCKVSEKSNEITAIPALLDSLDLQGATVTLDAMGCQYGIAEQIIDAKANFVLGLKGNQETLHDDVVTWFQSVPAEAVVDEFVDIDKGHGRIEERRIRISEEIDWLLARHPHWKAIGSIVEIESTRYLGETRSQERRYYISSLPADARRAAHAIHAHWGIENSLHWTLDMSFGEDQCRIRKGHAVQNMAVIRHAVITAIQQLKPPRQSVKQMRKRAGWSTRVLDTVVKALI